MTGLTIKKNLAGILERIKFNDFALSVLNRRHGNNYIRVVNYHDISAENLDSFEEHLAWYKSKFEDCNYRKLVRFFNREYTFKDRPGLIISFDDGFKGNYLHGYPLLEKYEFTGYFFIPAGLAGEKPYMDAAQLKELISHNHVIGCHTYSHHRMNRDDSDDILKREIIDAKRVLENMLGNPVEIFCWVGGEEKHYTKKAADYIRKAGYRYAMMTNSSPLVSSTDHYHINRTNIQENWKLSLVKFQLSGFMDFRFAAKRKRVDRLTKEGDLDDQNDSKKPFVFL